MSAVTGKGPKKVPASSGVVGENVKKAESKPVRPASRSPDEARADAVARVASLEAAIAALGDHDDQVRKSLEETLAKAKKSTNIAPRWSQIKFCDEIHRAHPEEGGNKGRRDCQEGRGSLSFAVSASRGDGKFGRSRGPIGVSQGRGGADQRSSDAASDRRIASGTCPFQIQGDQSNGVRRGRRQGSVGQRFAAIQEESEDGSRNASQSFSHWWSGSRPIRVDVHSHRPGRHSSEREWVPQPIETVTRDSRYGLRATRVGVSSTPTVSNRDRSERMTANRFVVLSSDEEEWVPPTLAASSGHRWKRCPQQWCSR